MYSTNVTNVQLTHLQLDNYGPWTVTPEPRREMDLQTLQSRLFADVAQFVGGYGGYVFPTRYDNLVAVTNGLDRRAHESLQESLGNRYPITVSLGIGTGRRPADALDAASAHLHEAGSAQDGDRTEVFGGDPLTEAARSDEDLEVAHFDVDDATGVYTDRLNEYDAYLAIERGYSALARYLREEHGALAFFAGGDNVIAVCPALSDRDYHDAIDHVRETANVDLKVGVGAGYTAQEGGMKAKHALEHCREESVPVVRDRGGEHPKLQIASLD